MHNLVLSSMFSLLTPKICHLTAPQCVWLAAETLPNRPSHQFNVIARTDNLCEKRVREQWLFWETGRRQQSPWKSALGTCWARNWWPTWPFWWAPMRLAFLVIGSFLPPTVTTSTMPSISCTQIGWSCELRMYPWGCFYVSSSTATRVTYTWKWTRSLMC